MATQPVQPQQQPEIDMDKLHTFMEKVVNDVGTAMRGGLCYIGDRLGIFKALAASGPVTAEELAEQTGLNARYLREWLGAMATAEYVEFNPWTKQYTLPLEHALPLSDESFPYFAGGFLQMVVPTVSMAPKIVDSFRSGVGVPQSEYSPEMFEAIERGTAPWYRNKLVQQWIPAMPQVKRKLEAGADVLDVGAGSGRAAITIAQAFPKCRVSGFDAHPGSVERARRNAKEAGLDGRVTFDVVDCCKLPENAFDFVTTFDVVHDSVDPVGLMTSIRKSLKPGGTFLMLEMNASGEPHENINPVGRMLYSVSTLYCMTVSLAHGGAGIGACMGQAKARDLAEQAGFQSFRKLPLDDPFSVLYELE